MHHFPSLVINSHLPSLSSTVQVVLLFHEERSVVVVVVFVALVAVILPAPPGGIGLLAARDAAAGQPRGASAAVGILRGGGDEVRDRGVGGVVEVAWQEKTAWRVKRLGSGGSDHYE